MSKLGYIRNWIFNSLPLFLTCHIVRIVTAM